MLRHTTACAGRNFSGNPVRRSSLHKGVNLQLPKPQMYSHFYIALFEKYAVLEGQSLIKALPVRIQR